MSKSAYTAFAIEDFPYAIFRNSHAGARDTSLQWSAQIKLTREPRQSLAPHDFEGLSYRPHILAGLLRVESSEPGTSLLRKEELDTLFLGNPALALRTLLQDYLGLHAILEPYVLTDPESVERLIMYFMDSDTTAQPTRTFAQYREALGGDPNRLLRTASTPEEEQSMKAEFASRAHAERLRSPAWAFYWLRTQPTNVTSLPVEVQSVILRSEEYSYLAALLLKSRQATPTSYQPLVRTAKSPRWIYHALRDQLLLVPSEAEKSLLPYPEWLVQYLSRCPGHLHPQRRSALIVDCMHMLTSLQTPRTIEQELHAWQLSQAAADMLALARRASAA